MYTILFNIFIPVTVGLFGYLLVRLITMFAPLDDYVREISGEQRKALASFSEKCDLKLLLFLLPLVINASVSLWMIFHIIGFSLSGLLPAGDLVDAPMKDRLTFAVPAIMWGLVIGGLPSERIGRMWFKDRWQDYLYGYQIRTGLHPVRGSLIFIILLALSSIVFFSILFNTWVVVADNGIHLRRMLSLQTESYTWEEIAHVEHAKRLRAPNGAIVEREQLRFVFANGKSWTTRYSNIDAEDYLEFVRPRIGDRYEQSDILGEN